MFQLPVPEFFSFDHCLSFLRRSSLEVLHRCFATGVRKAVNFGSGPVLFEVTSGDPGFLAVRVLNARVGVRLRTELDLYLRRWFDLDRDLGSFMGLAGRDPILKPLVKKYRGYRIVGVPDLFECLVWAVIGQQINLAFAYRLKQGFVEAWGESLDFKTERHHMFPEPGRVARLRPESLRGIQFSRQKIEYTINIARAFVDGDLNQERLAAMPFPEAKLALTRIKGVGDWTANYALMRCLGRPEAFPREDVGIHNALKARLKMDRKPTLPEVDEIFAKYRGHEAYASLYLWMSLHAD
ncbi:MAG: DNA-3-methyladenine glycosylase [Leptospirales bacterium]